MAKGSIFVDHTPAWAEVARELYQQAKKQGVGFVEAPVSGGQSVAVNGALTVMCGCETGHFKTIEPIAATFGHAVTLLGESGSGQLCKMVNQICIAGLVQGLSEAIAFGQAANLDMDLVLKVISKGAAQSWQMENQIGRAHV